MFIPSAVRSRRGLTLMEVTVAAALSLVVLTVLFQVLIPAYQASSKGLADIGYHQRALLLSSKLERDFGLTTRSGVGITTDGLTIHPRVPVISAVVWSSKLMAYSLSNRTLVRKELTIKGTPARAIRPLPEEMAEWPSTESLKMNNLETFQAVLVKNEPLVKVHYTFADGNRSLNWNCSFFLRNSSQ